MSFTGIILGIVIVIILKFVLRGIIIEKFAELVGGGESGNKMISAVVHFLTPGLIALIILICAAFIEKFCPQLATFLVVVAVVLGGILGLAFVLISGWIPFIGAVLAPAINPVVAVFWILLILAIVEFILQIVLPGLGIIISMIISIIVIVVMGGFAGDVFNILGCVKASGAGWFGENANAIVKKFFGFYIGAPKPF